MQLTRKSTHGFTMVELMVVIIIILVLIGILVPVLSWAKRQANAAATAATLTTISSGIEAYEVEFHMYPPSAPGTVGGTAIDRGTVMLAQSLMGYLPSADDGGGTAGSDYGFRALKAAANQGKLYSPFVAPDAKYLKLINSNEQCFVDMWGGEILYYRAVPAKVNGNARNVTKIFATGNADASFAGVFRTDDNSNVVCPPDAQGATAPISNPDSGAADVKNRPFWEAMGGDMNISAGNNMNVVNDRTTISGRNSFILISGGLDARYFTGDDIPYPRK